MVQDTAMPDRGSGGSGGSGGSNGNGSTAAPDVTGHSMVCSYTNCKAPTRGSIPFCRIHLIQIRSSNKQHASRPPPYWSGSIERDAPSATVPGQAATKPRKLLGAYVMRKNASSSGSNLRLPPLASTAPSAVAAVGPSTPGESALPGMWPRPSAETQGTPSTEQRLYDARTTDHHSGFPAGRRDRPYIPDAFPTPVESPPFSRLNHASNSPKLNHQGDHIQAQRDTLRTPCSRSREPDTSTSAVPPHAPHASHASHALHREPDCYLPFAQDRVSDILDRLRGRGRAVDCEQHTFASTASHPTAFSLDTYVYNQDASVSPLPPPPNVTINSAADIAVAASAASAAAALEESYAAAMAVVAATAATARAGSPCAVSSPSISSSHAPHVSHNHNRSQNPSSSAYIYAYMDPRVHWTRSRSKEWHANKQAEIKARGGRKANVGMAAQRIAKQKRPSHAATEQATASGRPSSSASVWVGDLPSEVLHNKAWTALLSTFAQDEDKRNKKARRLAHQSRQRYGT